MLSLRSVSVSYGSSQVLFDIALDVGAGEVVDHPHHYGIDETFVRSHHFQGREY